MARVSYNAHERPPEKLRGVFKRYQKRSGPSLEKDEEVIDFQRGLTSQQSGFLHEVGRYELAHVKTIFQHFLQSNGGKSPLPHPLDFQDLPASIPIYKHRHLPNLLIVPQLVPMLVQEELLNRLIHRDLVNPAHKTNVHLHYDIKYPPGGASFFQLDSSDARYVTPKDTLLQKPMNVGHFLNRKLRWITLGGQYDWTKKVYPHELPPAFPDDVSKLLKDLFPETVAEAAIVNVYSPGDTLALHRDVSEACENGLISLSIGCECLFIAGLKLGSGVEYAVLRLRSGDVVYMSGDARFAWHGVPTILHNTCPRDLESWPGQTYTAWHGWMASKRINLNVRQMN